MGMLSHSAYKKNSPRSCCHLLQKDGPGSEWIKNSQNIFIEVILKKAYNKNKTRKLIRTVDFISVGALSEISEAFREMGCSQ